MRSTKIYCLVALATIAQAVPTLHRRQDVGGDPAGWNIGELTELGYEDSIEKQRQILTAAYPEQGVFIVHDTPSTIPDDRLAFRRHTEPENSWFWGTTYGFDAFVVNELGGVFTFKQIYNQEYKLGGRYHQYQDKIYFCPKGKQSYELDTANWMARIDENFRLTGFSIPGTHDSASHRALVKLAPELGATQSSYIPEQLNNGVRFFDLRIGSAADPLQLRHGKLEVEGKIQDVFRNFKEFLDAHPSEALLCSIKWDFEDQGAPADLEARLKAFWDDGEHGTWMTGNTIPTLKEARGKIVFMSRIDGTLGYKLNINDNTQNQTDPNGAFRFQDYYTPDLTADSKPNYDLKWSVVSAFLNTPQPFGSDMLSLNFLSAVNIASLSVLFKPADWANEINARLQQWLDTIETQKTNLGVVAVDFENARSGDWSYSVQEAIASSGQNLLQIGGTVSLTKRIIMTNFD